MDVPPPIYLEAVLVLLEGHGVADIGIYHQLVAMHVIQHYVLKLSPQSVSVYQVIIYLFGGHNLDTNVSFNKVDGVLANIRYLLVNLELSIVCLDTVLDFEKENVTGAAYDECLVKYEVHLSESNPRLFSDGLIKPVNPGILLRYNECFGLPVNCVYFVQLLVVEAFHWKILDGAFNKLRNSFSDHNLLVNA